MSLIPYVRPEQATQAVKEVWEEVTRDFVTMLGSSVEGFVPNSVRILAHRPSILKAYYGFVQATFAPGALDERVKNLACLRTTLTNGCNYCTTHLYHLARAGGLTDDEILSVGRFEESSRFSSREKLAMRFARELTTKAGAVDGDILRDLTATFTPPEIVELTMSICLFNVFNRFNDVLGSEIDLDLAPVELYPRTLPTSKIST